MKFATIIMTHWSMNDDRSGIMRESVESLIKSIDYPVEIIIVDNGNSSTDSFYLLDLARKKKINTYIRNSENMHFAWARNQGLAIANGDYIVISDNDILYKKGWLSKSIGILEAYPERKIYATPFCDRAHLPKKYWSGKLKYKGRNYKLNMRAGSNCFIVRREDFVKIGLFPNHRIAGTKWTTRAVKLGYLAAVVPGNLAEDMAFRRGYNLNDSKPVRLDLGTEGVFFNCDEFKKVNPDLTYRSQMTVCKSSQ